jgi:AmiR/NasT family two-component response regulator
MMSRTGVSAQEAFGKLRKLSQQEHLKVAAVANGIVLEAVRRARARRSDGN